MSSLYQAIILSLLGITITFVSLGLLILVIGILTRVFNRPAKREMLATGEVDQVGNLEQDLNADRMRAAGIAVAVATLMSTEQTGNRLGKGLETPPGRWWGDDRLKES